MQLTEEENRIVTRVECLLVWDRQAETGEEVKIGTIKFLHEKGVLALGKYECGCPYCEQWADHLHCEDCLWPNQHLGNCRCEEPGSPYKDWLDATSIEDRKHYARQVFNLLYNAPMTPEGRTSC